MIGRTTFEFVATRSFYHEGGDHVQSIRCFECSIFKSAQICLFHLFDTLPEFWISRMASANWFPFECLPPELRNRVYEFALVSPDGIDLRVFCTSPPKKQTPFHPTQQLCPALLRVSRLIYKEALPVLYQRNRFVHAMYNSAYDALYYYEAQLGQDVSYRQGTGARYQQINPPDLYHRHVHMIRYLEVRFLVVMQPAKGHVVNKIPYFVDVQWLSSTLPAIRKMYLHSPPGLLSRWRYMTRNESESCWRGYEALQQLFHRYCIDRTIEHLRAGDKTQGLQIDIIRA